MAKEQIKTNSLSSAIDAQEALQSQLDAFKETFLKECKQKETSNIDMLSKMEGMERTLAEHSAIIQRLKDRMGLWNKENLLKMR